MPSRVDWRRQACLRRDGFSCAQVEPLQSGIGHKGL
jgi:hypothetical protein